MTKSRIKSYNELNQKALKIQSDIDALYVEEFNDASIFCYTKIKCDTYYKSVFSIHHGFLQDKECFEFSITALQLHTNEVDYYLSVETFEPSFESLSELLLSPNKGNEEHILKSGCGYLIKEEYSKVDLIDFFKNGHNKSISLAKKFFQSETSIDIKHLEELFKDCILVLESQPHWGSLDVYKTYEEESMLKSFLDKQKVAYLENTLSKKVVKENIAKI